MASNLRVDSIVPSSSGNVSIGTATGGVTIPGDLGIAGVLTYEDVTNVDSVGVITARSGVNVSGGEVKVGTAVTVSSGGVITSGIVTATNVSAASSVTAATFHGSGANLTSLPASGLFSSYALIEDQKGAGANGGTFTSGAWRTRDLNTEIFDPDNIVSISSNQFTLQAGNYFIEASAPAYHVDRHQAALYDITADNFHTVGTNEYAKGDAGTGSRSIVTARVTISSANVYEIRHRCQTTFATYGFGVFIGTSQWITDNNYTYVKIFKET